MTVNKIITKEFILPISSNDDNIAYIIDTQCCIPFLSRFYHNKPAVHIDASFAEGAQQNSDSSMNDSQSNKTYHVVRKIDEDHTVMLNLILFLQSLCTEDLIMIAKYHNLYFKNCIFQKVLLKEKLVLEQHLTLINWVYDHICIYLYNQHYKF